ncbi:hypothetical protein GCM10022251_59970 [Phytohabitans flavus]
MLGTAGLVADHDHRDAVAPGQHGVHLVEVAAVGDHYPRGAVLEEVGQLGVGRAGVHRYDHAGGPVDGEVALDDLDTVVEVDRRALARTEAEPGEVSRQPGGTSLKLPVAHTAPLVEKGDLVAVLLGLRAKHLRHRPDQVSAQHSAPPFNFFGAFYGGT